MENLFKANFMELCRALVEPTAVPVAQDELGAYLVSLDDTLTAGLAPKYPDVSIVASFTGRGLIITADESAAKKNDSYFARYEVHAGQAHYKSSGVVT